MKYHFNLSASSNFTEEPLEVNEIIAILSASQTTFYFIVYLSLVIYVKIKLRPNKMDRSANITIFSFIACWVINIGVNVAYCIVMLQLESDDPLSN